MSEDNEGPEGPENLDEPPAFFPSAGNGSSELIEVQIEGVFAAESNNKLSHFVLVTDGERKLPIIIGPFEARSIQLIMDNDRPDRPITHDLLKNILDRLEYPLDRVVIDDFWNTVYYAKLYLRKGGDGEDIEIDARPSDAIALAVRFEVPIYVADAILESAMDE